MKRKALCFLMGMLVLLLSGCQSEQEDLYSQALPTLRPAVRRPVRARPRRS